MTRFDGFLFSKLHLIGSKSEGPAYILQQFDYAEIPIAKKAPLWGNDPKLQKHLSSKVSIEGRVSSGLLSYDAVNPYARAEEVRAEKKALTVELKMESDELVLERQPSSPPARPFSLALRVKWPFRSIWRGVCPTSQIYDIIVERDKQIVWRWGEGRFFTQALTPVAIPGGDFIEFPETWVIDPGRIQSAGVYVVRAVFIASGQEVERKLTIKFAA